ncbi:MAG: cell wall-binding repeat-containing protein, partial [Candidatus Thermoplasmatota archaeon]
MYTIFKNKKVILALFLSAVMIIGVFLPVTTAEKSFGTDKGYDTGPSYTNTKPLKRATFINADDQSLVDDYAYMAGVPASTFKNKDTLYSHPLLFYRDNYDAKEDKYRSLNDRKGLDYFMEDWMSYCNGQMDQVTTVNVPKNKVDQWNAKDYKIIEGNNIYKLGKDIALQDWSYSDKAVIAVADESHGEKVEPISGNITGSIPARDVQSKRFNLPQINMITPQFEDFIVPDGYKYMNARLWWPCFYVGFPGGNITTPPGDPNLELFCKHEGKWMQSDATLGWNQKSGMDLDHTATYVYSPGDWRVGVTDVPTHSSADEKKAPSNHFGIGPLQIGRYGTLLDAVKNLGDVNYKVDLELYPGEEIEIPDVPMKGCGESKFTLTWENPDTTLGFSLIGPGGEEVLSVMNTSRTSSQEMHLQQLGECLPGEKYSICVFTKEDIDKPVEFKVEYHWKQKHSKSKSDSLSSASEGAVLASQINAPLLYTSSSKLPSATEEAVYKLGVKDVYLVDIGGRLNKKTKDKIKEIVDIKQSFIKLEDVYKSIRDESGSHDVVFTTIDPWSYWYVYEKKSAGELPDSLHLGPATYLAAHHGTPTLIVENHPRLSSSRVWHNEHWRRMSSRTASGESLPSVAEMFLTGSRVYDFLDDHGFDKTGMESMITVAGQFDIGIPWDRTFIGKAKPGRFYGSPLDTSYWISRSVFYPSLIFENPAMQGETDLINGSRSSRRFPFWTKLGLKQTKPSQKETF